MEFEVLQQYRHSDWFTGGEATYTVKDRTDISVMFDVVRYEVDGVHEMTEEYDIRIDEDGNEYVLLFEYHGEECRITAERR